MLKTSITSANNDAFTLLLARALDQVITESLFFTAVSANQPDKLVSLYDRIGPSRLSPRLFGYAAYYSESSLRIMLDRGGAACITTEVMIRVAWSNRLKSLKIIVGHGGAISQEILAATASNESQAKGRVSDYESLAIMLNHVDNAVIVTELPSLIIDVAGSKSTRGSARGSIMNLLLDRAQDTKVPEDALLAAACNVFGGSEMMQIFLEKDTTLKITAEVLISSMGSSQLDVVVQLLERVEVKGIMSELLETAARNRLYGGNLVRLLLKSANNTKISDLVFNNAISNDYSGKEVIQALVESFGPIEVTEDVMLKLIRQASGRGRLPSGADHLFDPALITGTVFLAAMSIDPPKGAWAWDHAGTRLDIRHVVVENALHLPVTPDILKAAARHSDVACFRTLWVRGGRVADPTELMQRAAKNPHDGHAIFQFLLDQVNIVGIDETLMLAIVGNLDTSTELLHLLLERNIRLSVTHNVLQTAIANTIFEVGEEWSLTFLLEHISCEEVTEDLFKTAATAGNKDFLCKLSQFCDMESPPGKWLDVARLYEAVALGDNDSLNSLLERGVDLEAAELEYTLPVKQAFNLDHVSTIQVLLSAGMGPDALIDGRTPLFRAAEWGDYEMVKVLADAGASLNAKGAACGNRFDDGHTPYTIAKKRGHVQVFKFLEQFKKNRDREREAAAAILT